MDKLQQARQEIDAIDREMAQLFIRRMRAVELVSDYKKENSLPIRDTAREEAMIAKNKALIEDEALRPHYEEFLRGVIRISCEYQEEQK